MPSNQDSEEDVERLEDGADDREFEADDEPEAEGDSKPAPTPEPSYDKANAISFYALCERMEQLWRLKVETVKKPKTLDEKRCMLLPPRLLKAISEHGPDEPPQSVFPILRLLMPEKDGSRRTLMKEMNIAKAYAAAIPLTKDKKDYQKLFKYVDPSVVGTGAGVAGDFSVVLMTVVEERISSKRSKVTIGQINALLDKLADIPSSSKSNHDWKTQQGSNNKDKKSPTQAELRARWVRKLFDLGLSPLEHKWLVRILLERLQFGLGWEAILTWYHPLGPAFWSAHNSLRAVCNKLCQPALQEMRLQDADGAKYPGVPPYMRMSITNVTLGNNFSPMLSQKTSFSRVLTDISSRHRKFADSEEGKSMSGAKSLAVRHPAFTVETKLDGERMMVHYRAREGTVMISSRRGTWYSDLYSPVLGPAVRSAVGKHNLDLILDGEVIAWDNARQETVPFGNNRTISSMRRLWMEHKGLCDDRDKNLHDSDPEVRRMNSARSWKDKRGEESYEMVGEECWLEFVAFDVVYVGGPHARDFLSKNVSSYIQPPPEPGSIVGLDGFERKKLLYRLIDPQDHEVVTVDTLVVRPDGSSADGADYFSPGHPIEEHGYPAHALDSISGAYNKAIPDLYRTDIERRRGLSDEQISQARARAIDRHFKDIVEKKRLEGLVFKDLSAPYVLDDVSRGLGYWHKFKPDYFDGAVASDLDVIIIGAYFATGLRMSGRPSSFLCACVDSEDPDRFFPLCKVNGGSIDTAAHTRLLKRTNYESADYSGTGTVQYGKWFREDDHGKSLPDFLSTKSYQGSNEDNGWRFVKKDYPDLWIRPEDSCVATLNAGEIVASDAFSAGLTLRFPRITRIREGADSKEPSDIESDRSLWILYRDIADARSQSNNNEAFEIGSPIKATKQTGCRFLTEGQFATVKKSKKSRTTKLKQAVATTPDTGRRDSAALVGVTFAVLEGNYKLDDDSISAEEAKEQGWFKEAQFVNDSGSVRAFIKRHGGTVKISPDGETLVLGGLQSDPRVAVMSRSRDILRWTFVFSLVHRWLSKDKERKNDMNATIKETDPGMLEPSVLAYLARPQPSEDALSNGSGLRLDNLDSVSMMKRALDVVEEAKRNKTKRLRLIEGPWQYTAVEYLEKDNRWILSCGVQSLWPYSSFGSAKVSSLMVLYPDLFDTDFGLVDESKAIKDALCLTESHRWDSLSDAKKSSKIAAALPLARHMGALVTLHLHDGVTHVLCDLNLDIQQIEYGYDVTAKYFRDPARGQRLLDRLRATANTRTPGLKLVSPDWFRENMWK